MVQKGETFVGRQFFDEAGLCCITRSACRRALACRASEGALTSRAPRCTRREACNLGDTGQPLCRASMMLGRPPQPASTPAISVVGSAQGRA